MNIAAVENRVSAPAWWAAQRLRYNAVLLLGAAVSSLCLLGVGWAFGPRLPCLEITAFSVLVGGVFFLFGMGLANIFYYLGPLSEQLLKPNHALRFRRVAFALGTAFSLLLIFLPVIGNLVSAVVGPGIGGQCE
jgi:hypothetical protein